VWQVFPQASESEACGLGQRRAVEVDSVFPCFGVNVWVAPRAKIHSVLKEVRDASFIGRLVSPSYSHV